MGVDIIINIFIYICSFCSCVDISELGEERGISLDIDFFLVSGFL